MRKDKTQKNEMLAQLNYILCRIDCLTQYKDSERAVRQLKEISAAYPQSLFITKYYVKALCLFDEQQLCTDYKVGY